MRGIWKEYKEKGARERVERKGGYGKSIYIKRGINYQRKSKTKKSAQKRAQLQGCIGNDDKAWLQSKIYQNRLPGKG